MMKLLSCTVRGAILVGGSWVVLEGFDHGNLVTVGVGLLVVYGAIVVWL